jgi:hypothetical protein
VLLGKSEATLRLDFPGGALIVTESDGAGVVRRDRVALIRHCENTAALEFLNRESTQTVSFFKTVSDAAIFTREDPIKCFGENIKEILDNCLLAATFITGSAVGFNTSRLRLQVQSAKLRHNALLRGLAKPARSDSAS